MRNSVDEKYSKHENQIKLAKDKSLSRVELQAAKRNTLRELQIEQEEINKAMKKDHMNSKIVIHEVKLARHKDFHAKVDGIRKGD